MFIVNSYMLAVIFCFITMLCWGSWGNTQKLAGALRAVLLGLCRGHGALRRSARLHYGQHGRRGTFVRQGSGAGRLAQYRQCRGRRRYIQRLEHPALGLGVAGRHGRGISAGRGSCACTRRIHQLVRCAQGRPRGAVRRRRADRRGDSVQRSGLCPYEQRQTVGRQQPQGADAGRRGRCVDVDVLSFRRCGNGPRPLREPDRGYADALLGDIRLLGGRAAVEFRIQHSGHAASVRRR